ncbi:riboflavin synthase alpha chain [Nitrosomonas cryotolerans]|uniref:Riboflavin synthase n=1 Tax=Nitrosomonas cryotolerans ATCC 49181 TaxID=1131553 RepID=A0A1N6GPE8_9PROT|nr:riboflavin synthase [Nitrosomonas cryotolerans]SFP39364.1 riboflavin synthase alpha chain [Nitrosomonas cryotolerans]SIO09325.1 riboflavin synthase alpha chain [Nitrosomonas cryotolerans ATCC 49181]
MFTGITEAIGEIKQITPQEKSQQHGLCLNITAGGLDLNDMKTGDSIAVNGACLTVTAIYPDMFTVDVSRETLNCTQNLDQLGTRVNLEKAMRLSDRLGGHLVSGHVDSVGEVIKFEPVGESVLLAIRAPSSLLKYMAEKGSITVNGVSLTINQIEGDVFSVNLIPHTLSMTTLNELKPGFSVNLETDMLARYIARLINVYV